MGSIFRRKQKLADGRTRELPTLWIKYYQGGRAIRESTGTTKETVARRILRAREGDVERGIPIAPRMGRVTFEEAAADLITDYTVNKRKSLTYQQRRVEVLRPTFQGRRLLSITTTDVRGYVAERQRAGAANATSSRELAALKRMFSLAVQAGKLHAKPYIPMLREDNVRRGFFEADQFAAVRDNLSEALRPLMTFAYLTGWRLKSEVVPLEWRQVDWRGRVVRLDPGSTKNRDGRSFPFTTALETLLREQFVIHERLKKANQIVSLVFHRGGEPIRDYRGAWITACRRAGCPGRIPHDFRRTAVRNLERAGVPRSSAMAMVGHRTEAIYRRYAIVDAGALRDAATRLDLAAGTIPGTVAPQSETAPSVRSA